MAAMKYRLLSCWASVVVLLIALSLKWTEDDICHYDVAVYAFPERAFTRFFARHLKLIERFFRKRTDVIGQLIVAVCERMVPTDPGGEESTPSEASAAPYDLGGHAARAVGWLGGDGVSMWCLEEVYGFRGSMPREGRACVGVCV